jgi:predicted DNA-binding protein with PD1-like motif
MPYAKWWESEQTGVIILSLGTGDLLLETLRQVAKDANMHTGVVLTGIGSLTFGRIHSVVTNDMPPKDRFFELPGPLEVVGFRGVIANYEPHIHISLMDEYCHFYGGHLEERCSVLTLSEISMMRVPDLRIVRRMRDGAPFPLLDAE